jgi:hypothetical protein
MWNYNTEYGGYIGDTGNLSIDAIHRSTLRSDLRLWKSGFSDPIYKFCHILSKKKETFLLKNITFLILFVFIFASNKYQYHKQNEAILINN